MKKKIIFIIIILIILTFGLFVLVNNSQKQDVRKKYSYDELSNMALEYFFKNETDLLPREEYHVGIDDKVIPKYENLEDMVVIEIRHQDII